MTEKANWFPHKNIQQYKTRTSRKWHLSSITAEEETAACLAWESVSGGVPYKDCYLPILFLSPERQEFPSAK
jgi:hypothetical protein